MVDMPHTRPWEVVEDALRDSDAGMRDIDDARKPGVALKTIRRWRREYQRRGRPRGQTHLAPPCPRCDEAVLDEPAYAELLGWYLGDGHVSRADATSTTCTWSMTSNTHATTRDSPN